MSRPKPPKAKELSDLLLAMAERLRAYPGDLRSVREIDGSEINTTYYQPNLNDFAGLGPCFVLTKEKLWRTGRAKKPCIPSHKWQSPSGWRPSYVGAPTMCRRRIRKDRKMSCTVVKLAVRDGWTLFVVEVNATNRFTYRYTGGSPPPKGRKKPIKRRRRPSPEPETESSASPVLESESTDPSSSSSSFVDYGPGEDVSDFGPATEVPPSPTIELANTSSPSPRKRSRSPTDPFENVKPFPKRKKTLDSRATLFTINAADELTSLAEQVLPRMPDTVTSRNVFDHVPLGAPSTSFIPTEELLSPRTESPYTVALDLYKEREKQFHAPLGTTNDPLFDEFFASCFV
jgi:hypothetical protein